MSTTTPKSLLIAGLGANADPTKFQLDKVEEVLRIELKKLSDAGFYSEHITLDPKDVAESMRKLKHAIANRQWDVFVVGFAVRGTLESTELFENAVNVWVESMPGKRLVFPKGPFDIASAPLRFFGMGN